MNFGVRLPGPFRVGLSQGRITGGVNVGPFSVSGQLGQVRRGTPPQVLPYSLEQIAAAARADGWQIAKRNATTMALRRGWRGAFVRAEEGGVVLKRDLNPRVPVAVIVSLIAALAAVRIALLAFG